MTVKEIIFKNSIPKLQKTYFAFITNIITALYCENISKHETHKLLRYRI